jgi:hypothetical protein
MPTATPRIIPTTAPPVKPTATVLAASSNPYPPYSGKLTLDDPLSDNSRGYGWDQSSGGSNRFCQFIGGAYHAAAQSSSAYQTCYTAIQAGNFAFEVQMQVVKGNCGGLEWRDTTNKRYGYHLRVCQDGSYRAYVYNNASSDRGLPSGSSTAIVTGLNQFNLIAVVANGSTFDFYVNQQKIDSLNDSSFSQGLFGVCASAGDEAAYTHARVWTL